MAVSYNTVTVTTSPTLIIGANNSRRGMMIFNNSSQTLYIGPDSSITTSNAFPLLTQASFYNSGERDGFRGNIYGVVAATTADVRYFSWDN